MKFKVLKGTQLYNKLQDLSTEMVRCNRLALELVEGLGYSQMRGGYNVLAGGVSSIIIEEGKPNGWRNTGEPNEYFPSKIKKNKELLQSIESLPVVQNEDYNRLIKYDWRKRDGNKVCFHPSLQFADDYVLISFPEYVKYKPVDDMVEITVTEFNNLKETAKTKYRNKKK